MPQSTDDSPGGENKLIIRMQRPSDARHSFYTSCTDLVLSFPSSHEFLPTMNESIES